MSPYEGELVKLAITIEIDVDMVAWGDEYGVRGSDVKYDVQSYVGEQLACSNAGDLGLFREIRVTKVVEKKR